MRIRKITPAENFRPFPLLIKHILAYSLVLEPEREIVYRDLVRYNYHTLNRRVRKLANVLRELGLDGGETIGVIDYDSHRFLECYFAVPMTGNVLHTVNWRLSPAQILYTINHAADKVLLVHSDFLPLVEKMAGEMPTVEKIIVLRDVFDGKARSAALRIDGDYETMLAAASDQYDFPDFDEDAVATTFYTTGTVGEPKGVYFTHRQLVLHTMSLSSRLGFIGAAACRVSSEDVYMPLTPMFHVHAWGIPYLATMYSMKQVYVGRLEPPMVARLLAAEKPSLSHCVPTILQMILQCPEAMPLDLSSWKVIIGGAALPRALAKAALERGIDIIGGYGMSETCPVIAIAYIRESERNRDIDWQVMARTRTGVPSPLVDFKLIKEEGTAAAADDREAGELLLQAPWLTAGYVNDPERGNQLWEGGYLHTGDVAAMDARHSLRITDRIKDVIKTGGEWISSIDLEHRIGLLAGVGEAVVVGLPDEKWGERPYAFLVLKPGSLVTEANVRAHIQQYIDRGELSKWAMPEQVRFVESIPRTSVGKIDKKRIRAENI